MFNKAIYVFVLVVFLMQSCGILFLMQIRQQQVKISMQEILNDPNSKFEKIVLTENQYNVCRINSHEISFKGEMYDIKELTREEGKVILIAIRDKDEENILELIAGFFQGNEGVDSRKGSQTVKLTSLICQLPIQSILFFADYYIQSVFITLNETVVLRNGEILTPPPKFFPEIV